MDRTRNRLLVDVCIVCALAEEAQAFLRVAEDYWHLSWDKDVNRNYGYDYRLATLSNLKGEPLRLHVSWLPSYGPQEMVLHLNNVIKEYEPRLAVMTGICAGDKRHDVRLGDLVVAERTFTYDNGKMVQDELGQSVHLNDAITYQIHENIKRFVDLFEDWKSRVAVLARPSSKQQQRDWFLKQLLTEPTGSLKAIPITELQKYAPVWRQIVHDLQQGPQPLLSPYPLLELCNREAIEPLRYGLVPFPFRDPLEARCHVRPLASGSAVRSDNPFEMVQVPVRGAIAIDMEGAAFGRVMQSFPRSEWLIVKGVSDYADREKDDSYHTYAEMASAAYVLCFIQAYVTQERLPPLSPEILSLEEGSKALWNGGYDSAKKELRKAIEGLDEEKQAEEASLARYLFALALLGGKLPRTQGKQMMERIEVLMKDAIRIHPCASYYQILAHILKDYYMHTGFVFRLEEVFLLEGKGASLPRSLNDEENEAYFRLCQPRLSI